ncbi:DEAD/DEAH box helicase [Microbacterium sp.]|uniref:DEAD/DEAH box helicase n=1 Tax=Microbacterium sp. TaxID=51671 RepID=UPI003C794FBE
MSLRDLVEQILTRRTNQGTHSPARFVQEIDSDGINFVLVDGTLEQVAQGSADATTLTQFVALQMLQEQGLAAPLPLGFSVASDAIVRIDPALADALLLPPLFVASIDVNFDAYTTSHAFRAYATTPIDGQDRALTVKGGCLFVGGRRYRADDAQWTALTSIGQHSALAEAERDESTNVALVGTLLAASKSNDHIRVSYFARGGWEVSSPTRVGVSGRMDSSGNLTLTPTFDAAVDPSLLESRWRQLSTNNARGVLRVEKHIVALDEQAMDGVREVLTHRTVPAAQVPSFLKAPSAFLDAALVDLDLGFSVRVEGVGTVQHVDFTDLTASGIDWFQSDTLLSPASILTTLLRSPDDIAAFESQLSAAITQGATALNFSDHLIDVSDPDAVLEEIVKIRRDLANPAPSERPSAATVERAEKVSLILRDTADVIESLRQRAAEASTTVQLDRTPLARAPFPHQVEGIEWLLGLISAADSEDQDELYRLQGALLADDMGLGKTFMALAAIAQYNSRVRAVHGANRVRPTLVVAPLSLLENWEAEVAKSFSASPFTDIVVLQSSRDLRRFSHPGRGRETRQASSLLDAEERIESSRLRLTLRTGSESGQDRLDLPGRLVLTTYETLRDYQLSMAQIDWSVVVFDEAQAIKNPNAMRTRAAKGLRATFKLVTTGTPVENSLGEFWCLVDTAQPGLLGDWNTFRDTWIAPILQADDESRDSIRLVQGKGLRDAVGPFMLRRIKEDHLKGLPAKHVHSPFTPGDSEDGQVALAQRMPPAQQSSYDGILRSRVQAPDAPSSHPLSVLTQLRAVSVHPELGLHGSHPDWPATRATAESQMRESGKLIGLVNILDSVRQKEEKVIIFAMSKDLQLLLSLWILQVYGLRPYIINGDTAAIAKPTQRSRRQLIEDFEATDGFNVIIMSPIAAGTGLTVVGANHVVHLERHWNPAKEAQATDRAYRIGQTREVHVYYPASIHPEHESFDVLIDRLLASKVMIKDAVMEQGEVSESELMSIFNLSPTPAQAG